jgi:hypothetical protein
MKTLAIRMEEEQHAELSTIAQLAELNVTDAIRQAIDSWIDQRRSDPELQARAEALLADIDRKAASRREAVAAMLNSKAPARAASSQTTGSARASRPKRGDSATA